MAKSNKVRFDIDHEELKRLYLDEGYSLRKLQDVFHICGEHIRATLEYLNIKSNMRNTQYDNTKKCKNTLTDYKVFFNRIKKEYMWSAKQRELIYNLTDDEVDKLINGNCHYCGIEPSQIRILKERDNVKFYFNGIDRVDNSIGYINDNVVSCCKSCNLSKQTMSVDEFYNWIQRVYNHYLGGEK